MKIDFVTTACILHHISISDHWFIQCRIFIPRLGQKFNRFCHYNIWALSRDQSHGLAPEDIDPFLCTHIILGFAEVDETGLRLKDPNHYDQEYL